MTSDLARTLNTVGLLAVSIVLMVAFADQLLLGELPCPLCILQRGAFVAVGAALALNLRFGPRPSHYGAMILSAAVGLVVAGRQTLLHIAPGSGSYGMPFLGLHFYVWAFITFAVIILGAAFMLLFDRQFADDREPQPLPLAATVVFVLAAIMTLSNGISTVLECGAGLCPDDPASYLLLPNGP
jgi:disulfide bond formation protein DsbB